MCYYVNHRRARHSYYRLRRGEEWSKIQRRQGEGGGRLVVEQLSGEEMIGSGLDRCGKADIKEFHFLSSYPR